MEKKKNGNKRKALIQNMVVICSLSIMTIVVMMQSPLNIWCKNGNSATDSSVFKTIAFQMNKGLIPYRDSFDHKGPLIYIYNWLGIQLNYWKGIWMIELVSLFFTVFLLYKTARLLCGKLYSCFCVFIVIAALYNYFEQGNYTEEYAMPFIAAALYIFMDYFLNDRINRVRLMICGLSFGAVCLLRINMIAVWIVFCIAVLISCITAKDAQRLIKFLLWFLAGFTIISLPILTWLIANGAFESFLYDYFTFNSMYTVDAQGEDAVFNVYYSLSHFINNAYIVIATIITVHMCIRKKSIFNISYLVCICVTLVLMCMSGRVYDHYGMVLIPILIYPFSILSSEIETAKHPVPVCIALWMSVNLCIPTWFQRVDDMAFQYKARTNEYRGDAVGNVVSCVKGATEEDEQIIVWGNWNIIYALSERLPASVYSYQDPIFDADPAMPSAFFDELQKNLPKLIVIQPDRQLGQMEEFIDKNDYDLLGEFQGAMIYTQ